MLFNSVEFLFVFLPIMLVVFGLINRSGRRRIAIAALVVGSLFFYGWWNPAYLLLILISMVANFWLGNLLIGHRSKGLLTLGVLANLATLGFYKYTYFFTTNANALLNLELPTPTILLPLAISFFTFQQIAYLVDSYRGEVAERDPLNYALFITFFPQLIAGPIVHHKEMLPQFASGQAKITANNLVVGVSIFAIGLFKKTVIADSIAVYATPIFASVDGGQSVDFFTAWAAALAYTFQLYFDFSGYSDMAIGLARMFGIKLPINFYSPYKATSISEFWRRWHMTLSRFLRDYLYIPLGGNRAGELARLRNLFITMLLGGIWHGAGWNFLIWGGLHGSYLIICHRWAKLNIPFAYAIPKKIKSFSGWLITFIAVVFGWVFFKASTLDGAITMLHSMLGGHGISLPSAIVSRLGADANALLESVHIGVNFTSGSYFVEVWLWNIGLLFMVLILPTTQDIFSRVEGALSRDSWNTKAAFWPGFSAVSRWQWQANTRWALVCAVLFSFGLLTLGQVSEFLYFQF
jgi:D-alanyl-lipoteichoic acid acyltransferase DltB (MBOAT superfamily)